MQPPSDLPMHACNLPAISQCMHRPATDVRFPPSSGNYVRGCAIHQSFYRCVSLHGTHEVDVSRNVAYAVAGHCYYLEDVPTLQGLEPRTSTTHVLPARLLMLTGPLCEPL